MNASQLLAHFDRISEAPDAVPRLRRFILDLAVRGKLVEQDASDEPASVLARRIASDVRDRIASRDFAEPRNAIELPVEFLPFTVPSSWAWARLIEIADVSYGFAFESARFNASKTGTPLIRIRDISGTDTEAYYEGPFEDSYLVHPGDYLVGMDGDFNVRRWRGPSALLNQRVMRISNWRAAIRPGFLAIPLQMVLDHLHASTSQTTVKHLSAKQVNGVRLPLPPIAEQRRIVAKVDELMALCDRLERAQTERETRRDRLVAASLNRLNEPAVSDDAQSFHGYARFHLRHLPRLTTRPEHIRQLRQTILNLAVRGRLVPQDPADEPAPALLGRIQAEKARLPSGRKARPQDSTDPLDAEGIPFEVPASWLWLRLGDVLASSFYGPRFGADEYAPTGIPTIRTTDMTADGRIVLRDPPKVSVSPERVDDFKCSMGDLLVTRTGSIGTMAVFSGGYLAIPSAYLIRLRFARETQVDYVYRVLKSPMGQAAMGLGTTKVAQPNINAQTLAAIPIPLPPLAEQSRIVAKVDELFALCDRLETQLTTAHSEGRRLLEALLQHALAPVAPRNSQVAP